MSSSLPAKILVCTHNPHKLEEIEAMLDDLAIEVLSTRDFPDLPEPEETGETFLANALIKADAAFAHTGLPSLADDSGLVVPALGGAPGIYSARYAGVDGADRDQANCDRLRQELAGRPRAERAAHFHCSLVLRLQADHYLHVVGECHGEILDEERGSHGFGYDPLFWHPPSQKTLAELLPEEKNRVSHRAHALQQLRQALAIATS